MRSRVFRCQWRNGMVTDHGSSRRSIRRVKRLATLDAWTRAEHVARTAYALTLRPPLQRHLGLADQIRRAAVSIPANVVEGYALGSTPQFVRHLKIALGSAAELSCHLRIARDLELCERTRVDAVVTDAERIVRILVGLIRTLIRRTRASRIPNPQSRLSHHPPPRSTVLR